MTAENATKRVPKVGDWVKLDDWTDFREVAKVEDFEICINDRGVLLWYLKEINWIFRDEEPVYFTADVNGRRHAFKITGDTSPFQTQIGGAHYKDMPIQPFEFSMRNHLDPMQHSVIKYVTRFRNKGGREDLEKAKHVIDLLISFEYERNE